MLPVRGSLEKSPDTSVASVILELRLCGLWEYIRFCDAFFFDAIFVLFRCGDCVILQFIGVFNGGIGLCLDLIRVKGF